MRNIHTSGWYFALMAFMGSFSFRMGLLQSQSSPDRWLQLLGMGLLYDLFVACILGLLLLLIGIGLRNNFKLYLSLCIGIVSLYQTLLFADLVFFTFFKTHYNNAWWSFNNFNDILSIGPSISDVLTLNAFGWGLLFPSLGLIVFCVYIFKGTWRASSIKNLMLHMTLLILLGVGANSVANLTRGSDAFHPSGLIINPYVLNVNQWLEKRSINKALLKNEIDVSLIKNLWKFQKVSPHDGYYSTQYPWIKTPQPQSAHCSPKIAKKKNVLIILLESFDALSTTGLSPNVTTVTPNLFSLKDEGIWFTRAYSNGSPTSRALIASLCSFYPDQENAFLDYAFTSKYCLSEILTRQDYETAVMMGVPTGFDNQYNFWRKNGFSEVIGEENFLLPASKNTKFKNHMGKFDDEALFEAALVWMDKLEKKKPFYLALETVSNHHPWSDRGEIFHNKADESFHRIHQSMRYTDFQLGKFIQSLKKKPYYQDTLIIIFSDHYSRFGENKEGYPYQGWFSQNQIPLLILNSNQYHPGKHIDWVVSQVDIVPTVMDELNLCETTPHVGHSMLDASISPASRFAFNYIPHLRGYGWADHQYGLVWYYDQDQTRLFDLKQDPYGHEDLSSQNPNLVNKLKEKIKTLHAVRDWSLITNHIWKLPSQ
jgi:phosphoglycerol transferase MdoB-like AlkP superfamily enzyme